MKIREVVDNESLAGKQLKRDLLDFVIGLHASNVEKYSTSDFVREINDLGHAVSVEALINLWGKNKKNRPDVVRNITTKTITLSTPAPKDQTTNDNNDDDQSLKLGRQARRNIQSR